jgi:hypothetical protein
MRGIEGVKRIYFRNIMQETPTLEWVSDPGGLNHRVFMGFWAKMAPLKDLIREVLRHEGV